jgi:hypothetical protein
MVEQPRVRREDNPIARASDAQAEIHVVEVERERLVEAADLFIDLPPRQQTGPRHGGTVPDPDGDTAAALGAAWGLVKKVRGHAADADRHANVLQASVGVKQLRADGANLRLVRIF